MVRTSPHCYYFIFIVAAQVADCLENAAAVIGFQQCLGLLVEPLAELSSAVAQGRAAFDWRAAEAVLFCVRWVGGGGACAALLAGTTCRQRVHGAQRGGRSLKPRH